MNLSIIVHFHSEANVFHALFGMGQNNGHHSVSIIQDFYHEVEPCDDEKFGRNNHSVAGLIVLANSTSLKHDNYCLRIPQKVFTYAVAFFGRISHVFADIMDADSLLQYLSHCYIPISLPCLMTTVRQSCFLCKLLFCDIHVATLTHSLSKIWMHQRAVKDIEVTNLFVS
ncbi:hypothetical protein vseg_013456 [Gypsophila vaccaria]